MSLDLELLSAWRAGDRQAGEHLFQRHIDRVHRFLRNKVSSLADQQDLAQGIFMACVEGADRYEGRSEFSTYLLGIAHKKVLHYYRSRARHEARFELGEVSVADLGTGPWSIVARSEEQRLVLEGLRNISLDHQVCLELYFWEGMTTTEISEVLGIPAATSRRRLQAARQALRKWLDAAHADRRVLESTKTSLEEWARGLRDEE